MLWLIKRRYPTKFGVKLGESAAKEMNIIRQSYEGVPKIKFFIDTSNYKMTKGRSRTKCVPDVRA